MALPAEKFTDAGAVRPVPVSDGVTASVIGWPGRRELKGSGIVLFLDKGKRDGVAPGDVFEVRRKALGPVLAQLEAAGPKIIPHLLPLTYTFSWASLFVPGLLFGLGTDESVRLLAELSMFRTPYFAPKCLACLEQLGPRTVPQIAQVMEENSAFDELKTGLITVLGTMHTPESCTAWAKSGDVRCSHCISVSFVGFRKRLFVPLGYSFVNYNVGF